MACYLNPTDFYFNFGRFPELTLKLTPRLTLMDFRYIRFRGTAGISVLPSSIAGESGLKQKKKKENSLNDIPQVDCRTVNGQIIN